MILGADGAKLSKRHGALGVMEYRAMGFMPEAMLNYLVRLGWSHGDQEMFTRQEMIEKFDFDHVSPRSEEHTSELQSLMRISYAVFCLKKKKQSTKQQKPKLC